MDATTHSTTEPAGREHSQPRTEPCTRACTRSITGNGMAASMNSGMELPTRNGRCPRGFSTLQIAVLSVLKSYSQIIAYWQIAELVAARYGLATTEGAVRGALERMYRRSVLMRTRAAAGSQKGNRYAFTSDPCPHIIPYAATEPSTESSTRGDVDTAAQSVPNAVPSILEEIDRKNLSISSENAAHTAARLLEALTEEDIAFHWPELARHGFGTDQIRQMLHRLAQVNIGPEKVMQGLTYAEWELAAERMRDKKSEPIASPANWVFSILAKQGYYPRPSGYVSPQEQAERDAAEERKRCVAAQEERLKAECDAWIAGLSPDEREGIVGPQNSAVRMPDTVTLRNHFRTEIWPTLQNGGVK